MNLGGGGERKNKKFGGIRNGIRALASGMVLLGGPPLTTPPAMAENKIVAPAPIPAKRPAQIDKRLWNSSWKKAGDYEADASWFAQKLEVRQASEIEILKMAQMVKDGRVPLRLQIAFMNLTLAPGGYYYKQFTDPNLDPERHSAILELVSRASVLLTKRFQENPTDPSLTEYFDIAPLRLASRGIWIENNDGSQRFCNGYLSVAEGDVYFVTADHCVDGTKSADSFTRDRRADLAVIYIPPEWYSRPEWDIRDVYALQSLTTAKTPKAISGALTASYSLRPDPHMGTLKEIVHFSYALPTSQLVRVELFKNDPQYPGTSIGTMFLKPHTEGRITRKDAKGNVISIEASGSSGSNSAVHGGKHVGYFAVGALSSVRVISDDCKQLCYAISLQAGPERLRELVEKNRRRRMEAMISSSLPLPKM